MLSAVSRSELSDSIPNTVEAVLPSVVKTVLKVSLSEIDWVNWSISPSNCRTCRPRRNVVLNKKPSPSFNW